MADIILSPIIEMLFEKLVSPTLDELIRCAGIHSEVEKWKTSLYEIRSLLNDASQKEVTSELVKGWLNSLHHLAYDIDDILDALATVRRHHLIEESGAITKKVRKLIPTCCTSFSVSTRMHDKLNNITTKLQDLETQKVALGLNVINGRPIVFNRKNKTSLLDESDNIVGRQGEKEALLDKLLGEEPCSQTFSIVPIVGMGGIGKTTLAQILYNETHVQNHFTLKAWVCVSDEFNILNVSNIIFESVTKENKKFTDLNLVQEALRQQLMNKRFLLVLDDVWSESYEDWNILVRPFLVGAFGSKIIITTRKEQLLKELGCDNLKHLQSLSYNDSVSLFCQHALGVNNLDSHPNLRAYGEGIVKKCDGLPLALRVLGRLLRTKTDEVEWKVLLNSEIWRLQKGDGIIPALRLSYHDLRPCLKQLFAYCSLFPKDYMFEKEELILLWMAEGFLRKNTSTMERLGQNYFEELLSRSFFQQAPNDDSLFIMHDLMNDLATYVAGDLFFRSENEVDKGVGMDTLERYRHMSYVSKEYIGYMKFKEFDRVKNLRTFLAVSVVADERWHKVFITSKILADLLHKLPLLRVLSLSYLQITEVPEFIGSLKHLRYLNLRRTRITYLPETVCDLYNLETLIVFGCYDLTKLPNSFSKLKKLRHFDVRDTPLLRKMPLGIGELKSLQTLSKIIIGEDDDFPITMLKRLENIHEIISIEGLDKVQNEHELEANLLQMRLSALKVKWSDVFDGSRKESVEKKVLDLLKPCNDNLKTLEVLSYGGTEFPNWVGDPFFHRLTHVEISGCKKSKSLPPLGQLPSLKQLLIQGMDEVKLVDFQLLGSGVAFASLEILSFKDMEGWEVWSTNSEVANVAFPRLQELRTENCPNLIEVSLKALPSLRILKIKRCVAGVLRSLVNVASLVTKLNVYSISGLTYEIWRGVIEQLGAVEEVRIDGCDEIRYLWESEAKACKVLVSIRKLEVSYCNNLVSLGEKEEDECQSNLSSLRMLRVAHCNSMEECSCPNGLESLYISGCSSITTISFPKGDKKKKLKSVGINDCPKIFEMALAGGRTDNTINASMSMLDFIGITNCSYLKSIGELSCFIHLSILIIIDCPNMESFPVHELPNLPSLKTLGIAKCPSMDVSFSSVLWPPKLCHLKIGGLKKPMSEWSLKNFPTSLNTLVLYSEDVSSFSRLSHLLPSSLTHLVINEFTELKSLSTGLQHLTSLQNLEFSYCPKMKHLPKQLSPSLLSLVIYGSPKLKKRCSRKGSYRRFITHIPRVMIEGSLI